MKGIIKAAAAVAATVAMLGTTGAQASDNINVTVNATIVGVCKFNGSQTPVVNITNTGSGSNIDPSLSADATGTANVTYRCSNGTTPNFSASPSTQNLTCASCPSGSNSMSASIGYTSGGAGTGLGSGQDKTLVVTGTITSATYANASAGSYTGTLTVNVTP